MNTGVIDGVKDETRGSRPSWVGRWAWRVTTASVVVTGLIGLFFLSAMNPSGGPYAEDRHYPFGDPIQTWQTTVGFDWLAYAILLGAALVAARQLRSRRLLAVIGASFALIWLPHVFIALAILTNGA